MSFLRLLSTSTLSAALIASSVFFNSPVYAQQGQRDVVIIETLNQAFERSFLTNPNIKSARAELRATMEQYPQALANFFPEASVNAGVNAVNLKGDNAENGSDGGVSKEVGFSISQSLFSGGQNEAERAEALNDIYAAYASYLNDEQELFLDVVNAYMNVVRDRTVRTLQQRNEDIIQLRLDNSILRFENGEATRADVDQARARLARATSDRIDAEVDLDVSLAEFENITGARPADNLAIPNNFFVSKIPQTIDSAIEYSRTHNPEILEAQYDFFAARDAIDIEKGELLPDVSLEFDYSYQDEPQPGDIGNFSESQAIAIRARMPLFEGGALRSNIREAKSQASRRKLDLIQEIRNITEDIKVDWEQYKAAIKRVESRRIQVDAAQKARDGVFEEVRFGERVYIDLLDADQELLDAQVEFTLAQRTAIIEEFSFMASIGALTALDLELKALDRIPTPLEHLRNIRTRFLSTSTTLEDPGDEDPGVLNNDAFSPLFRQSAHDKIRYKQKISDSDDINFKDIIR